ncbi:class I SAM-dependent methyltransferase [Leptolyngbya ohadii]|uniref:class I SAM-dependent methyltransferase n=1 Tax=Leptolyngbya ohadii TaxID=1962290 RepID=UPI000B5A13A3|nr:class I SAM-dependent methyltransferase [Leptolyngbya ohadii]
MTGRLQLEPSNPALCQIIADRIASSLNQRITFAEFMDLALYEPQHGYYARFQSKIGAQGDFATSPHLGSDFGELLAVQFAQMWETLDRPNPFTLVEMGAGQGLLAQDIVRHLHKNYYECFAALRYVIVEKSPAFVAEQKARLKSLIDSWGEIQWQTWEDIPADSIVGCCFSNELVDAFPVHRVVITNGQLQEIYIAIGSEISADPALASDANFVEVLGEPSTPRLTEYFQHLGIDLAAFPNHYRTEVNLAAIGWLHTVSDRLKQGYLLTIDYGYPAHRYYNPTRSTGTLQCYYRHAHHDNPYRAIGYQDITAHVNFTALEQHGTAAGLEAIGFTQQGLFLMALGLGDRLMALSQPDPDLNLQIILQRREALHGLMNPIGLGNFGVLIQSKGLPQNISLQGLQTL